MEDAKSGGDDGVLMIDGGGRQRHSHALEKRGLASMGNNSGKRGASSTASVKVGEKVERGGATAPPLVKEREVVGPLPAALSVCWPRARC